MTNKDDILKEQLRAMFSDFEAPAPSDGWEKLEQSLNAAKRAKIIRRNWYIGSVAAVAIILIVSVLFVNMPHLTEQNSPVLTESAISVQEENSAQQNINQNNFSLSEINKNTKTASKGSTQHKLLAVHKTVDQKEKPADLTILAEPKVTTVQIGEIIDEQKTHIAQKTSKQTENETEISREEIERLVREFANAGNVNLFDKEPDEKMKKPIMLALSGKGALKSSQKIANNPMTLRSASTANTDNYEDIYFSAVGKNNLSTSGENMTLINKNIADNVAEMEHLQPVSAGITISKNVFDKLSIETGLVYTYLYSKAKNSNPNYLNKETQHFHYLGIPVNFNYNIATIGNLGLYTSLGAMVEKDIYGEYRSIGHSIAGEFNGAAEDILIRKIKQDNFQFSLNAGIGLYYPIYKGFNLYAKLGGVYYFDAKNYQYKTIYSDKKINLDLNAGIRFDF